MTYDILSCEPQQRMTKTTDSLKATSNDSWSKSILVAAALWAATRLTFSLIGTYSFRLNGQPVPWISMWLQWDASYYLSIARGGYQVPTVITGLEIGQSNLAFSPMMPLMTALVHLIVPSVRVAGLIAANACLLTAAAIMHRLVSRRFDGNAANWAVLSLMTLPGSFALSSPLSEAPFLALSIAAAYLAPTRSDAAAASSALLTITRVTGIFQAAGFALDWLVDRIRGRGATYRRLLPICLAPLPLLLFFVYMLYRTGDAFAQLHSQFSFWQQRFGIPFQSLLLFTHTNQPRLEMVSVLSLGMILITLTQARWFSLGEMLFVVASVASFASMETVSPSLVRYTIGLYPVHMAIGRLCGRYVGMRVLLLCLALIGSALATLWFHGSEAYV